MHTAAVPVILEDRHLGSKICPPVAVNIASGPRVSDTQHIILQGAGCVTCTPPPRPIPCPCHLPGLSWACPATRGGSKASCQSLDSLRVSQSIVSLRNWIGSKGFGSKAMLSHFADNPLIVCEFGIEVLFSIPNSPDFPSQIRQHLEIHNHRASNTRRENIATFEISMMESAVRHLQRPGSLTHDKPGGNSCPQPASDARWCM